LKNGNNNKSSVGYRIEDERPTPVNGVCSFTVVREIAASEELGDLVEKALSGNHRSCSDS